MSGLMLMPGFFTAKRSKKGLCRSHGLQLYISRHFLHRNPLVVGWLRLWLRVRALVYEWFFLCSPSNLLSELRVLFSKVSPGSQRRPLPRPVWGFPYALSIIAALRCSGFPLCFNGCLKPFWPSPDLTDTRRLKPSRLYESLPLITASSVTA